MNSEPLTLGSPAEHIKQEGLAKTWERVLMKTSLLRRRFTSRLVPSLSVGESNILNQTPKDWHTRSVTLSETKGLAVRFFATLRMTRLDGHGVKCTNVVCFDLAKSLYVPKPYPGRVIFFQTQENQDVPYTWEPLIAGGIEVHEIPGDHDTMWHEPQVQILAEKLKTRLAQIHG